MHDATTRYRYDGQMGVEDAETSSSGTTVTRYGLGARGVDLIERTGSSGTVTAFPLYDAHGNNVASLTRDGSGGYQLGDRRRGTTSLLLGLPETRRVPIGSSRWKSERSTSKSGREAAGYFSTGTLTASESSPVRHYDPTSTVPGGRKPRRTGV